MHWRRRRCSGDASAKNVALHIEPHPHRRCIGDAARSSDPTYPDPIRAAQQNQLGGLDVQRGVNKGQGGRGPQEGGPTVGSPCRGASPRRPGRHASCHCGWVACRSTPRGLDLWMPRQWTL
eukprot:3937670-Pyramimonas_sp.AAC.1